MAEAGDLPGGWEIWSREAAGPTVLVYRPDIFDGAAYPAACLPTIYLARGQAKRPPSAPPGGREAGWRVSCHLEPAVMLREREGFDSWAAAWEWAREMADRFAAGEIDFRAAYTDPRPAYLERLEALTGDA